jgi:hypothetical protein
LLPPVSPTGRVSAALKAQPQGKEAMIHPTFIEIDGKRLLWREIVLRRREQLKVATKAVQAAFFELKDDTRPTCERTAARRYLEPSLSTLLDAEG